MNWLPANFHFLHPDWLRLLLAVPVVALLVCFGQRTRSLAQLADTALLPHLTSGRRQHRWLPASLAGLVVALASVALAGPSWHEQPTPLMQQQPAQVLALSLSRSMYANDLPPNRMERARFKVSDLLRANAAGQNGLIGFAGAAFVVAPVTRDARSLANLLAAMRPDTMPVDGEQASAAIRLATSLLIEAKEARGLIVLVTDNADAEAVTAAAEARAKGLRVSVLGIGLNDRKPVTLPDGSLLHDAAGNLVLSQRNDALLQKIASVGGGTWQVMTSGNADVDALANGLRAGHEEQQRREVAHWQDAGVWLLPPLLVLMLLLFRRGWVLVLLLVLPFALPRPAVAAESGLWNNLWWRADQQAARAIAQGKPAAAEKLTDHPDWQGAGAYGAGHYDQAIAAWQRSKSSDASYNLGNALARAGRFDEAIQAYEQALKLQPDNADAKANLELLKKMAHNPQDSQDQQDQQNQQGQQGQQNKQGQQGQQSQQGQQGQQDQQGAQHKDGQPQGQAKSPPGNQPPKPGAQDPASGQPDQSKDARQPSGKDASSAGKPEQPAPASSAARANDRQDTRNAREGLAQQMDQALKDKPAGDPQVHQLGVEGEAREIDQLPPNAKQLLMSVPDDPGALLRRKFQLEYQQRKENP